MAVLHVGTFKHTVLRKRNAAAAISGRRIALAWRNARLYQVERTPPEAEIANRAKTSF